MISQQFPNISPEKWSAIKTKLAHEADVLIDSDEGSGKAKGVKFAWHLGSSGNLYVTIESVSFGLKALGYTEDSIMSKFAGWIESVQQLPTANVVNG